MAGTVRLLAVILKHVRLEFQNIVTCFYPWVIFILYIVCSVHQGMFSTSGVFSTSGDIMTTSGDIMTTSGGYHDYIGGYHDYIGGYHEHI